MGTIIKRPRRDGTVAYLAQIVVKSEGRTVVRESRTFDRRKAASDWIKMREAELKSGAASVTGKRRNRTLADAIDIYIRDSVKQIGRTKAQVLQAIKTYGIADRLCSEITSADIVEFARQLGGRRKPSTVANYLSHLSAVFAIAESAWDIPLDYAEMVRAATSAKRLGMTAKSRQRERRPTLDEIDALLGYFEDRSRRSPAARPMVPIILFALFSTRRQEEVTRIMWADLDEPGKRVRVRDMKNPGEKAGNDVWCGLTDEALAVIRSMPRTHERIFPYDHRTVSAAWTRACKLLAIDDLHFHDLRHEGISWLFERGWTIPQVAYVSGHRSWNSLKRYAHMREAEDRFAGWSWRPDPSDGHTR